MLTSCAAFAVLGLANGLPRSSLYAYFIAQDSLRLILFV